MSKPEAAKKTKKPQLEEEENSASNGPDPATFAMPENSPFRDDIDLKKAGVPLHLPPPPNAKASTTPSKSPAAKPSSSKQTPPAKK